MRPHRVLAPFIAHLEPLLPRNKLPLICRPLLLALNAEPHSSAAAIFPAASIHSSTPSPDATHRPVRGQERSCAGIFTVIWSRIGIAEWCREFCFLPWLCPFLVRPAFAQLGNSGSIEGVVKDPSGSSVAGATVEITNPISGFHRDNAVTGTDGSFRFTNVPFNPYHLVVPLRRASHSITQDVDVRSTVPTSLQIALKIGDRKHQRNRGGQRWRLWSKMSPPSTPMSTRESSTGFRWRAPSSSVTSLVTLVSPGVAADSNGNMHGLGDHAQNSFSVDGQPITDQNQQSVFESDSSRFHSVAGGHFRSSASGIRRQDQPRDQGHHEIGPGCYQAHG